MSHGAAYAYHVGQVTGLDADSVRYRLPYAQGLQLLALRMASLGHKFIGLPLPEGETFSEIAGYG